MTLDSAHGAWAGRTAIVVGAASGIGAATSRLLAARGAAVCCADLDGDGARRTAAGIEAAGERASAVDLDVRDEAAWERLEAHGTAQALINAAGITAASPLADTRLADWRAVMAVNLDGAFLATRFAMRTMHDGAVVHVGSASGLRPPSGAAAYAVSKGALGVLVRSAARECRDAGLALRVLAVCPAGVRTPLWQAMPYFRDMVDRLGSEDLAFAELERDGGRFAYPEEVAAVIAFLASPEAGHVTGVELAVDGGYIL
jgi:NAD(P)-dependent dehydrogenase (short-subunit alcohol dehydrogenase family)